MRLISRSVLQSAFQHLDRAPLVDSSTWVAPTAVLCGDVRVGPGCAVSHGAVLDAGDGVIALGRECVVMENAVIEAGRRTPVRIGNHVLIGPRAYLTGCTVEDEVFLATGSTVFTLATVGRRAEVRINGVVHLRTRLERPPPDGTIMPELIRRYAAALRRHADDQAGDERAAGPV